MKLRFIIETFAFDVNDSVLQQLNSRNSSVGENGSQQTPIWRPQRSLAVRSFCHVKAQAFMWPEDSERSHQCCKRHTKKCICWRCPKLVKHGRVDQQSRLYTVHSQWLPARTWCCTVTPTRQSCQKHRITAVFSNAKQQ